MGDFNPNALGARPVEGGRENDGSALYIAQAPIHGSVTPGKIRENLGGNVKFPPLPIILIWSTRRFRTLWWQRT